MSSNENIIQAALTKRGRKALKGNVGNRTDEAVRRRGALSIALRGGGLATAAVVGVGFMGHALGRQASFDTAQAQADAAAFDKTIFGSHPEGTGPKVIIRRADGDTSGTGQESATPDSETPDTAPDAAASDAAPIPAQGDWQPTPGATDAAPADGGAPIAAIATGQTHETGGVAPDTQPPTGGVEPN